ncbi:hypothetical protein L873DRAFT_1088475 [Choiromyces venosus 120613-1]|uniref:Uncharacterized protein n=1 Tax=Choiromyces venosus 120613-1 TaxID=1336337 RepID=A0A3N4JKK2_9PEZI|nr:hypothetical protein L873DRAFT_1088475 [Choiromyces venosus 120613-1]
MYHLIMPITLVTFPTLSEPLTSHNPYYLIPITESHPLHYPAARQENKKKKKRKRNKDIYHYHPIPSAIPSSTNISPRVKPPIDKSTLDIPPPISRQEPGPKPPHTITFFPSIINKAD